jgi:hypothetical protein
MAEAEVSGPWSDVAVLLDVYEAAVQFIATRNQADLHQLPNQARLQL